GSQNGHSTDLYGNVSVFTVAQTYACILGKALVSHSDTITDTTNMDGGTSHTESILDQTYNAVGKLISATGSQNGHSTDLYGNTSTFTVTQTYTCILGKALVTHSDTITDTTNMDGGTSHTESILDQTYDAVGKLISATGSQNGHSTDLYGNTSTFTVTQTYTCILGKALVSHSETITDTTNLDGGTSHTDGILDQVYDGVGKLVSATGSQSGHSTDLYGNTSTFTVTQTYVCILGKALVTHSDTTTDTSNLDGGTSHTDGILDQVYNAVGKLISATGSQAGHSTDLYGNTSTFTVTQTYICILGKALVTHSD